MNLRQIEVFRAVMSTGSVSDASRLLHVSVPAVSRMLSYTESRLGFPLFERVKGRLHPTAEARRLYHEVQLVYRGVERIGDLVHELAERRHGLISIGSSPSVGQMLVPQAIAEFHIGNPEVRIHFHCMTHARLKEQLLGRQIDLGISTLPMEHPSLRTSPLAASRLVCICPPSHPLAARSSVSVADLLPYPLIAYPHDTPFGQRIDNLYAEIGETPRIEIEAGLPHTACALVHAGAGIALVDEFLLRGWPGARFRILPVEQAAPIVADLVYPHAESLSPVAEALIRVIRGVMTLHGLSLPDPG
ncbi:LysR family transcriptional regulator [Cupriavidus basilensis]|uniref:LysR family transcriptional regulator n=1 Tax=Cupriavidus basilensis TaxID=68895 RepID=UPI0007515601|nr:LysR family transcriptional regulator [Cupriavidus basilensis]